MNTIRFPFNIVSLNEGLSAESLLGRENVDYLLIADKPLTKGVIKGYIGYTKCPLKVRTGGHILPLLIDNPNNTDTRILNDIGNDLYVKMLDTHETQGELLRWESLLTMAWKKSVLEYKGFKVREDMLPSKITFPLADMYNCLVTRETKQFGTLYTQADLTDICNGKYDHIYKEVIADLIRVGALKKYPIAI